MENSSFTNSLRKNRWLIAFLAVFAAAVAGYTVGKDMALRDNARDRIAKQEAGE